MSIKNCINQGVAEGRMDPARAAEAQEMFDAIEAEYLDALGPEGAAIKANAETVRRLKIEAAVKKRQALMQASAQQRLVDGMKIAMGRSGAADRSELALAAIDSTGMNGLPYRGAEQERKAILGRAHHLFADAIEFHGRGLTGSVKNKASLLDVLREAFGETTGNANAKAVARAWYDVSEFLRKQFNVAGGTIGKLERWGMPQHHDTVKVRRAGFQAWRDATLPRLDRKRMIDDATGAPFSDAKLEVVLREVYDTIRTEGFSKVEPSGQAQGRSVANRRSDHRFLHFKTADDWLAYQKQFGHADPADIWDGMLGHIAGMSRDIGAMRALGPNPRATVRFLQQTLQKDAKMLEGEGAVFDKQRNRLETRANHLPALYETFSGEVNAPINAKMARSLQTVRHLLIAAQLGSATLSAVSDLNFHRMTARMSGLNEARLVRRVAGLLNPANKADRALAVRSGLIADTATQMAAAQARYTGEIIANDKAARLSDFVLRATGLSAWTQAGRWAFGMEFMATLAEHVAFKFDELPKPLRRTLDNYDIGADAWDMIRKTPRFADDRGASFLRPDDIAAAEHLAPDLADDLATRVLAMIQTETEYAVPSTSVRGRAALAGASAKPGTIGGELLLSGLMYKSFSVTMAFTHLRRMAQQQGAYNKARYAAHLVIGSTLFGALSIWLKDISKGRDPSDAFSKEHRTTFWPRALIQGGGVGIFGDFLLADYTRYGQNPLETALGPVAGFAGDTLRLGQKVATLDESTGGEALRYFGKYLPGNSVWYARVAFERLVLDQVQRLIDPDAKKRWRRIEKRTEQEMGSRFWWPRGSVKPARAPDLSTIGGDQ